MKREGRIVYLTEKELRDLANPYRGWRLAIVILAMPAGIGAAKLLAWFLS